MPTHSMRAIAIYSSAGGVGKTTTAINLAVALAKRSKRTLLVDLDPRACLLRAFGLRPRVSLFKALLADVRLDSLIRPTELAGISLLTASPDRDFDEQILRAGHAGEGSLRAAIESLTDGPWDFILFDCGTSLRRLADAALAVLDQIITPIEPGPIMIGSLSDTFSCAINAQSQTDSKSAEPRMLISRAPNSHAAKSASAALRTRFDGQVLRSEIPNSSVLTEASAHFEPVLTFRQSDKASVAYRGLASEVLAHG